MTKPRYLTKSRFKLALECPSKLYYTGKDKIYANCKDDDSFLKSLADGGFQVGELAKMYYPEGADNDITEQGYDVPLKRTNELLKQKDVVIFEPAFLFNNLFIRVDVLVKRGNDVQLIEVKAKSYDGGDSSAFLNASGNIDSDWKPYLYDVAFQKYVMEGAFPDWNVSSFLMLADKSKVASVNQLNAKFKLKKEIVNGEIRSSAEVIPGTTLADLGDKILSTVQVDDIVERIYDEEKFEHEEEKKSFKEIIHIYADAYASNKQIKPVIGGKCKSCEFKNTNNPNLQSGFKQCWKKETKFTDTELDDNLFFDLWDFRSECVKKKLISEERIKLTSLKRTDLNSKGEEFADMDDNGITRCGRQWIQIEKAREIEEGEMPVPEIDATGLKIELESHEFPLHFIDFETSMVAIPFYKGQRPYEQVAFQFSHHIMEKDGSVRHEQDFIEFKEGVFPNFNFLRALKKSLGGEGTIFRYAAHENTVLCQILAQLEKTPIEDVSDKDELIAFVKTITKKKGVRNSILWEGERNMVDMLEIVKKHYYHPDMKGSNSIKAVLPSVINTSQYIRDKYSAANYYGKNCTVKSKRFEEPMNWIQEEDVQSDPKRTLYKDPYKLLPDVFEDYTNEILDNFGENYKLADGGSALVAFAKLQFEGMSAEVREEVKDSLLRYCELDTLAMVMIYEYWRHEVEIK